MESKDAKICPLFIRNFTHAQLESGDYDVKCVGKDCMLYVSAHKDSVLGSLMVWEGCGLVHQVAWKFKKPEKKPQ